MKNGAPGAINRVYRLVWNESTNTYVAVPEITAGRGKGRTGVSHVIAAVALAGGMAAAMAQTPPPSALPKGGSVVQGQAQINQNGLRLDVNQSTSRTAINWQSFDIGAQAQVNFSQPSQASVALNRVTGGDASQIFGKLTSNGQVVLVNPNGIAFGKGSQVDVGGIVASSLNLADADFMGGKMLFQRTAGAGAVTNEGSIQAARGGYAALLAPEVRNEGVVRANLGTVALAGGDAITLDLQGSQLLGIRVDAATIKTLIENRQLLQADGGQVILAAGAARQLLQQAVAGSDGANRLVEQDGVFGW